MKTLGKKRGNIIFIFRPSASMTSISKPNSSFNVYIDDIPSSVGIMKNQCGQPIFKSWRVEIDFNTIKRDPRIRIQLMNEIKLGEFIPKLVHINLNG